MTDQRNTVHVVQFDDTKDFSSAGRFGALRYVFQNPRWPYNPARLLQQARGVLREWREGDYLLMVGDPTLCAVCMAVVTEQHGAVDVLRWDRFEKMYTPQRWDFDGLDTYSPNEDD